MIRIAAVPIPSSTAVRGRTRAVGWALAVASIVMILAWVGDSARAATVRSHSALAGAATPAGGFSNPTRMALDQDADVLYVLDVGNGVVDKFDVSGAEPVPANFSALSSPSLNGSDAGPDADQTPQNGLGLGADSDIAVDNSGTATDGNVYVVSHDNQRLYAFAASGSFLYALDGADSPATGLGYTCGVAVDDAGAIYVADFNAPVHKYVPAGGSATWDSDLPIATGVCRIAVDSAGDLYANHYGFDVEKFDASSSYASLGVVDPGPANAVAVDPSNDDVYADRATEIAAYDSGGASLGAAFGWPHLGNSFGIAVEGTSHAVFVSDSSSNVVHRFGPAIEQPVVTTGAATGVGASSATLNGTVDPDGLTLSDCSFEYVDQAQFEIDGYASAATAPCTPTPAGDDPVAVSADLAGLSADTTYRYRLTATAPDGTANGDDQTFRFDTPVAPEATALPAAYATDSETLIGGSVDPNGFATTYYIEYSTQPDFSGSTSIPASRDADAGSGSDPLPVSETVGGLDPETTYYVRVVATNSAGTDISESVDFETTAVPDPEPSCPNGEFRTGPSQDLPDCRAFEKITPADKNGGDAWAGTIFGSDDVHVLSNATFLPGQAGPGLLGGSYLAHRTATAWTLRHRNPMFGTKITDLNADFSRQVLANAQFEQTVLPEDTDAAKDIYTSNVDGTGVERASKGEIGGNADIDADYAGQSADGSHIYFLSYESLEPEDAGRTAGRQLYERVGGETRVVALDSDESLISPGGAVLGHGSHGASEVAGGSNMVSSDGSHVFFESPDPDTSGGDGLADSNHQLYVRIDGQDTVHVSASQCDRVTPECDDSGWPATFEGASDDGSIVYFDTSAQLVDADTDLSLADDPLDPGDVPDHNRPFDSSGSDIYSFEVATSKLTLITDDCLAADGSSVDCGPVLDGAADGVSELSEDGNRLYFLAPPDRASVPASVWLYDAEEGTTRHVMPDLSGGPSLTVPSAYLQLSGKVAASPYSSIDSDGSTFIVQTERRLTAFDNEEIMEVYRYEAETGRIDCISCNRIGRSPRGAASINDDGSLYASIVADGNMLTFNERPKRLVSQDDEVVFATYDSLLPQDTNGPCTGLDTGGGSDQGCYDVYLWDQGNLALLTSGNGRAMSPDPRAMLGGFSPDGRDLFVATADRLVPADTDFQGDAYTVRIGGGLAVDYVQSSPACSGDACQARSQPPSVAAPASRPHDGARGARPKRRTLSLRGPSLAQRRRAVRTGIITLRIQVNAAGRVQLLARSKLGRRVSRVASKSVRLRKAGATAVSLRLSKAAKHALRSGKALAVAVEARRPGARSRTITIRLPGASS